jgi:hypothetical protein
VRLSPGYGAPPPFSASYEIHAWTGFITPGLPKTGEEWSGEATNDSSLRRLIAAASPCQLSH